MQALQIQQQPQQPAWLNNYYTAFGGKGLIALAWWVGALHAQDIRALQGSFPILQVNGAPGVGKSTLFRTLWRLTGAGESESIQAGLISRTALHLSMAVFTNRPVVIEDESDRALDWQALSHCYEGGVIHRRLVASECQELRFRGALALIGGEAEVLNTRSISLWLERQEPSEERLAALANLDLWRGDVFAAASKGMDLIRACLEQAATYIDSYRADISAMLSDSERGDPGDPRSDRPALNYAQLACLIDALAELFCLPEAMHRAAHKELSDSVWMDTVPY